MKKKIFALLALATMTMTASAYDLTKGEGAEAHGSLTFKVGTNENAITAKVDVSEMMGSEVHLHVNADGKDVVIIVPTMDLEGDTKSTFAYGAEIKFTFAGHVCHVFDKDGKNLEF